MVSQGFERQSINILFVKATLSSLCIGKCFLNFESLSWEERVLDI